MSILKLGLGFVVLLATALILVLEVGVFWEARQKFGLIPGVLRVSISILVLTPVALQKPVLNFNQ